MDSFPAYSARKTQEAQRAALAPLTTVEDRSSSFDLIPVGNPWSRDLYDGPFHLPTPRDDAPIVSLVFVQSRDGNTAADDPAELGGGPVDKHVLYEGLSRVAADAVLAGAKTADGTDVFFSVWHPSLVELRAGLGLPRHPAQVIVSGNGSLDLDRGRVFNAPDVPVFILSTPAGCARLRAAADKRPTVELVPFTGSLRPALEFLRRTRGIARISAVGGRTTASALIDEGLVQDVLLTTTTVDGGEPGTPFYAGHAPLTRMPIVRKRGTDPEYPIVVEHFFVAPR
jgi:riboflavin biosynthesis pyrimidine reductase